MNQQSESRKQEPESPPKPGLFDTAGGYLWRMKGYLAVCAATIAALVVVFNKAGDLGEFKWVALAIGVLPLVAAFLFQALPEWLARRRAKRLADWEVIEENAKQGFFRIGPYEDNERDRNDFDRADKVHERVLSWIRDTELPILILTGASGTGKSSLLNAYVIPELEKATPRTKTITQRSFDDPMIQLRKQLLEPDAAWSEPPAAFKNLDVTSLVRKACKYLEGKKERLLLVFDQFEELMIVSGGVPERIEPTKEFLQSIRDEPIGELDVVLSLRTDYKVMLDAFGLPPLEQGKNWFEVPAFTTAAAKEFLLQSGYEFGAKRLESILTEAASFEETPGLVRPITVNMLGNLVRRLQSPSVRKYEPGTMLMSELRICLDHSLVKHQAAPILRRMFTTDGTKQPRPVGELASETAIERDAVEGCLVQLSSWGIVRRLHRVKNVGERVWEISHDFVVHLVSRILAAPQRTLLQRLRPATVPASLIAWLFVFAFVVPDYLHRVPERAANALRERYNFVVRPTAEGYQVIAPTPRPAGIPPDDSGDGPHGNPLPHYKIETLHEIGPILQKLGRVSLLNLSESSFLTNVDGLRGLTRLQSLDLSGCNALTKVDVLSGLTELQKLNLGNCDALTNVDVLSGLTQLQNLYLDNCDALTNVDGLSGLTQLQNLYLDNCDALTKADVDKLQESLPTTRIESFTEPPPPPVSH